MYVNEIALGYHPGMGHTLDKLRHTNPKLSRKLHTQGKRLSRAEQYAIVVSEGKMASVVTEKGVDKSGMAAADNSRNFLAKINDETFHRVGRLRKNAKDNTGFFLSLLDAYELAESGGPQLKLPDATLKRLRLLSSVEQKSIADFVGALCDHWEKPRAIATISNGNVTAEALALITQWQAKLGVKTQLDAVRRLCELANAADNRATRILTIEQELAAANKKIEGRSSEISMLVKQRDDAINQLAEAKEVASKMLDRQLAKAQTEPEKPKLALVPTSSDEAQNILLDFTAAVTGMTATADPSGEVVVALPAEKMNALFPIWQRAVRCLGIAKKAS